MSLSRLAFISRLICKPVSGSEVPINFCKWIPDGTYVIFSRHENRLASSTVEKFFRSCIRAGRATFDMLIRDLTPALQKQDTNMRRAIPGDRWACGNPWSLVCLSISMMERLSVYTFLVAEDACLSSILIQLSEICGKFCLQWTSGLQQLCGILDMRETTSELQHNLILARVLFMALSRTSYLL